MLADPALLVAKLVEPPDNLQIPLVAILQRPLGRMRRHGEIAEFHCLLLSAARSTDESAALVAADVGLATRAASS
jgi:hypothetical protein